MSDQPPKKPQLSRFGSVHARSKAAAKKEQAGADTKVKAHGYNAANYHQNANRKGIHSLVKFDCPICQCKNTVVVDLDSKTRIASVRCTYCLSLKPRPPELPYPYTTPFTPHLENKADAFFRFHEAYRALLQGGSGGLTSAAGSGATGATVARPEEGSRSAMAGGLLGGLEDALDDMWDVHAEGRVGASETAGMPEAGGISAEVVENDAVDDVNAFFNDED